MRQAIRRWSHVRLPVVVASPNTSAYFSRSAAMPMRASAASSFATSVAIVHLGESLEISASPVS
jgi:hypothetical protein